MLWSLLPMIAGILAARAQNGWLFTGCLMICLACTLRMVSARRLTIVSSFLAGWVLMMLQSNSPHEDWFFLPPREAVVHLEICELFNARKPGHIAGIGRIHNADIPHDTVSGHQAAFYLKNVSKYKLQFGIGQILACRGVLTYLPAIDTLDDYQLYLKGRDIFLNLGQGEIQRVLAPPPPLEHFRLVTLDRIRTILVHGGSGPDHPGRVLASMVLGDRSLLNDERIELYKRTGTFHLFAVSGLHVGSFAIFLHFLARLFRIPGAWRILPVLCGTWSYVWLTGSSPSSVRAGIMISCATLSRNLLRQPHLFPAITFSAWLVLLLNPRQLFDLGFQLSYGVVASIILTGLPMAKSFREHIDKEMGNVYPRGRGHQILRKFLHGIIGLSCVSLSAGTASIPLIVQHFALFTPGGLVLGILLNPLASLTVMLGCLAMLCGCCFGILPAGWIAMATWPLIRIMEKLLHLCLSTPGAVANGNWSWPPTGTCILLIALLLAWILQHLRQNGRALPTICHFLPLLIVAAALTRITINA